MYQFKAKNSDIKPYPLCSGNIAKGFTANNIIIAGLNGYGYYFSVDYNIIDTSNIIVVQRKSML